MSVPPPPPADDEDAVLASLVAQASIATPSAIGAARSSTSALRGDRGQISFASATESAEDMMQVSDSTTFPSSTSVTFSRSTPASKFGVVALRTSECAEKLLCLGLKRGGSTFCIDPKCAKAGDHGTGLPAFDLGPTGGLFIAKNPASAFCTPVVHLEDISQSTLEEIQAEKHSMEDWMKKFVAIKRLNQVKNEGNLDASLKETEKKISSMDKLSTPFTLQKAKSKTTIAPRNGSRIFV